MVLQESDKSRIKEVFKASYEAMQNAKTFNESARDMKSNLAKELKVKTEVINNAFTQWVRIMEKPEVVNDVDNIIESII